MKKILALLLAVIIVCAAFAACGTPTDETINGDYTDNGVTEVTDEPTEDNSPVDDDTKIFAKKQAVILMGQSNMAGRGHADIVEAIYDERIYMLHDDEVIIMKEPIHQDKKAAGVGLAASFAKAFVETFDQEILLVPCAYGGTSLSQWQKNSTDLFTNYYGNNRKNC